MRRPYHALPEVVADLLRLAAPELADELDLSTLERMPGEAVDTRLLARASDMVWRVRFKRGRLAGGTRSWAAAPGGVPVHGGPPHGATECANTRRCCSSAASQPLRVANAPRNVLIPGSSAMSSRPLNRLARGAVRSVSSVSRIAVRPPAVMPFCRRPPANTEKYSGKTMPAWKPAPVQRAEILLPNRAPSRRAPPPRVALRRRIRRATGRTKAGGTPRSAAALLRGTCRRGPWRR